MLSHQQVRQIDAKYGCPFYLFDEDAFRGNFDDIVRSFGGRYERFILAYSYKTNYIPYLCNIIKRKGGWAEVVSRLEYDLALKVGQNGRKIIFNGPVKHYEDIELALGKGSTVNLDSWYEVDYITRYAKANPRKKVKIGLRINIALSDQSGSSHIQEQLKTGRFGFFPDAESISRVASVLAKGNVTVNCLHGHTSTTDRSTWCYKVITETLCSIAAKHFPQTVEYINIGGGIFGYVPPQMQLGQTPSFEDYASVVCDVLRNNAWVQRKQPCLVLEPGVAMAANAMAFVTKVIGTKEIQGKAFITVDGSAFNTKPTFHKINLPYEVINKTPTAERQTYSVVGSTCMEKDYILTDITDTKLEKDDYVKINNVGAYTVVLSPPFINPAPAIIVKAGKGYKPIRKKQTLRNMFSNYSFK
jgi:diaminopimelate decarboxylase